ncbi:MAG: flagellar biosynthesis anti-sigma factor FlgM [Gammaproteobacteria bacterium]|nr:flagellar biosynthesis anti-sigma factor FlgM [Gammaproteobacteria bacterium]MBU1978342.1 flagellar biosynthesis anti-sigma factor FlgM [Gammaproteobacteria bacterium]
MKIDASVRSPTSSGVKETAPRASNAGMGAPTAAPQGKSSSPDKVQITALSSQLQAMESSMNNVPVVDSARVEAIKLAISEGRFKINPEVIADSLLETVNDLMQNQKS